MIGVSFPQIIHKYFTTLFGSYIRPFIEHVNALTILGLAEDADLKDKMQENATKVFHGMQNLPYDDRVRRDPLYPLDTKKVREDILLAQYLMGNNICVRITFLTFFLKDCKHLESLTEFCIFL